MKIKLGKRNKGATVLLVVITITLAIVLIAAMFILAIRTVKRIQKSIDDKKPDTNELAAVWYTETPTFVLDTMVIHERVEKSTNLFDWTTMDDVILPSDQPMDFTPTVDKAKPMEFFRLTIYGTNQ